MLAASNCPPRDAAKKESKLAQPNGNSRLVNNAARSVRLKHWYAELASDSPEASHWLIPMDLFL